MSVLFIVLFKNVQLLTDIGAGFLFGEYKIAPIEIHIVMANPATAPATAPCEEG